MTDTTPSRARILRANAAELERDAEHLMADRAAALNPHNRRSAAEMRQMARNMRGKADAIVATQAGAR